MAFARNKATTYHLASPDKKLQLTLSAEADGGLNYSLTADKVLLIEPSPLGFQLASKGMNPGNTEDKSQTVIPSGNWTVSKTLKKKHKGVWKPVWGKRSVVPDLYNELTLQLQINGNGTATNEGVTANNGAVNNGAINNGAATTEGAITSFQLTVRAYNNGVAFRYEVPERNVTVKKAGGSTAMLKGCTLNETVGAELTAFNFTDDYTAWYYNGERHNIGPEKLTETGGERLPVMTIKVGENAYLALHEANLEEGEPLRLHSIKGEKAFRVASKPNSLHTGYRSAWRVILYGRTPGALIDSHLIELLNPEPEPGTDFSWVQPGVCLWDWRINGAVWDGYRYTMSYPSWIRMIDFAAENGFKHLVLDANWYGPEFDQTSDPVKGDKAKDVQNLIKYGKEKGVGVWLYLNDVGGRNYPIEQTLEQYGRWGAAGVKYGFMNGNPAEKNQATQKITRLCAQNKLLVNFHDGPVHPYGQLRTWPNAVTREYCKAQLDGHQIFHPKTFVTSVFVNMVAGPLDMNNGMFDLRQGRTTRVDNNQEVPSTVVSEAARTLIVFSGATIIPDIPEYYQKYPALLRFLSAQQMPWKASQTLAGEIGSHIVMMRQAKDGVYLIGAATNEEARTLEVPLTFLPKGSFTAEIVQDGPDAHYLTNRETCTVSTQTVTKKDVLTLYLAAGGGACVRITQQ
jgi:alpha-glucosidase